jgi:hypothetical protein
MEGVSPEALRSAQREAAEAARKLAAANLELAAAQDTLEVYARATSDGGRGVSDCGSGAISAARRAAAAAPDQGKSEAELRSELEALREVLALEAAEREKVRRGRKRAQGRSGGRRLLGFFSACWPGVRTGKSKGSVLCPPVWI